MARGFAAALRAPAASGCDPTRSPSATRLPMAGSGRDQHGTVVGTGGDCPARGRSTCCRVRRPDWRPTIVVPCRSSSASAAASTPARPSRRRRRLSHREQLEPGVEERERLRVRPLEPRRPRLLREDPVAGLRRLAQRLGEPRRRVAQQPLAAGERVGRPPPRERDDDEHAKRQRHDGVERVGPLRRASARPV